MKGRYLTELKALFPWCGKRAFFIGFMDPSLHKQLIFRTGGVIFSYLSQVTTIIAPEGYDQNSKNTNLYPDDHACHM
jgi:hypothetical protein